MIESTDPATPVDSAPHEGHTSHPTQQAGPAVPGTRPDHGVLALPESDIATVALRYATTHHTTQILNHSIRSFLFARLLQATATADNAAVPPTGPRADTDLAAVDPELLFLACTLHDIGLTTVGDRAHRFEIDGADVAAELLTAHGVTGVDVDAVWDAIALHSTVGPAARRSPLCALTQAGIWADFGHGTDTITDRHGALVVAAYPRENLARELVDQIVAQTEGRPGKAPRYSFADALVQERATFGRSRMEHDEPTTRWLTTRGDATSTGTGPPP